MPAEGWIKLARSLIDWEWYNDDKMLRLFLHLLLTANFQDVTINGCELKRGQRLLSRRSLSKETNLSEQTIRTCMNKLLLTGEIVINIIEKPAKGVTQKATQKATRNSTQTCTVVTLVNYDKFQGEQPIEQPVVQPTSQPQDKNLKNLKKKDIPCVRSEKPVKYFLTQDECFGIIDNITSSPEIREAAYEWVRMRYAKKGDNRLTERSIKSAFDKIKSLGYTTKAQAVACFNQSSDRLYNGLFPVGR